MRKICHLCKKEKTLLKKSHILSDFLYKDLYDENHKLISFEMKELKKITPRISKPSTGVYEGGILCFDCDNNVIGNYENYVSRLISNKLINEEKINCLTNKNKEGINFINLSNINYNYTKLFLLSLLWRTNISTRREYKEVSLGPYEEKIRSQLLNGKCLEHNCIQINVLKFDDKSNFSSFIGQPRRHKIDNSTVYSIILNGYLVIYHLKTNKISKKMIAQSLLPEGTLNLILMPKKDVDSFIITYTGIRN